MHLGFFYIHNQEERRYTPWNDHLLEIKDNYLKYVLRTDEFAVITRALRICMLRISFSKHRS